MAKVETLKIDGVDVAVDSTSEQVQKLCQLFGKAQDVYNEHADAASLAAAALEYYQQKIMQQYFADNPDKAPKAPQVPVSADITASV